jgi:hypothetical protein
MITEPKSLRARLLDAEPVSPSRRRRLEQEISGMFNFKLSRGGRRYWAISLAAAVFFTIFGIGMLIMCRMNRVDTFIQIIWWIYTLANAGFVILAARILQRGELDVQRLLIWAKLSPALTLLITLLLFVRAINKPTIEAVLWVLFGIICLLMAMAIIIYNRVVASEMRQREHVLRMELRLEDLIERLGPDDEGPGVTAGIR